MRRPMKIITVAAAGLALAAVGAPSIMAHDGATGVVKERMDNFKASQSNLKAIAQLIKLEELDQIAERANSMREWGVAIPAAFPEGSGGGVSDAKPAIWENFTDFSALASSHVDALDGLIAAAEAGDASAVKASFQAVAGTCKACHMKYRQF